MHQWGILGIFLMNVENAYLFTYAFKYKTIKEIFLSNDDAILQLQLHKWQCVSITVKVVTCVNSWNVSLCERETV